MEQLRVEVPPSVEVEGAGHEERAAPRFTLLIRAAKLVARDGEFICVIRDVSSTGVSLRGFHTLPSEASMTLELQTGEAHVVEQIWQRGNEAGYRFLAPVKVHDLVAEAGRYRKRQLRLRLQFPITLATQSQLHPAHLINISQQGARIESANLFAIDQPLRIVLDKLPGIAARVRWRRGVTYGVVFDDTFSLKQLAVFATSLQRPALLAEPGCAAARRPG